MTTCERRRALLIRAMAPIGGSARGYANELLAEIALEVERNPYDWASHPDVLTQRIGLLPRGDQRRMAKLSDEWAAVEASRRVPGVVA